MSYARPCGMPWGCGVANRMKGESMADLVQLALRRKLIIAEAMGNKEQAKRLRARTKAAEAVEEVPEPEPENEDDGLDDGLDAIEFASPAAREAAKGMTAESFKRRRKSSDHGFTKADVERIAGADSDDEEEG